MKITIKKILQRILPKSMVETLVYINHSRSRLPNYRTYVAHIAGKRGIEIGGPSLVFKTRLPIYQSINDLDGVNFSQNTLWEGKIGPGHQFKFTKSKTGMQFIAEASDLSMITDNSYQFLLSSNCLEHVANPIKALFEWRRVVQPGGVIVLVLPNKISNFDHRRPTTSLAHLIEDFKNNTSEHDLTHLDEILSLHDLSLDPPAGNLQQFRERSLDNFKNRTLHHHVFDRQVIQDLLSFVELDVIDTVETRSDFFALARKPT